VEAAGIYWVCCAYCKNKCWVWGKVLFSSLHFCVQENVLIQGHTNKVNEDLKCCLCNLWLKSQNYIHKIKKIVLWDLLRFVYVVMIINSAVFFLDCFLYWTGCFVNKGSEVLVCLVSYSFVYTRYEGSCSAASRKRLLKVYFLLVFYFFTLFFKMF